MLSDALRQPSQFGNAHHPPYHCHLRRGSMAETHQDLRRMNTIAYILLMILVTNAIRILPVTLIRKRITNPFLCSFLYYVPYVTLSVMTFPAIVTATSSTLAGSLALVFGILAAWKGCGLFPVSALCCIVVFIVDTLSA